MIRAAQLLEHLWAAKVIDLLSNILCVGHSVPKTQNNNNVAVAQWLEHCVSIAKLVGSIPRKQTFWQYKCIAWMHCKLLWIKASAKCTHVNVINHKVNKTMHSIVLSKSASLLPSHAMGNLIYPTYEVMITSSLYSSDLLSERIKYNIPLVDNHKH